MTLEGLVGSGVGPSPPIGFSGDLLSPGFVPHVVRGEPNRRRMCASFGTWIAGSLQGARDRTHDRPAAGLALSHWARKRRCCRGEGPGQETSLGVSGGASVDLRGRRADNTAGPGACLGREFHSSLVYVTLIDWGSSTEADTRRRHVGIEMCWPNEGIKTSGKLPTQKKVLCHLQSPTVYMGH